MAQQKENQSQSNKTLVEHAFRAWHAGTRGPFDLLAEDSRWTIVGRSLVAKTYASRESFLAEVIRPFNARMSEPLVPTVREVVAAGDRVIVRFDAEAISHDGEPYRNSYAWFLTFRDGKIVEATAFFDSIAFDELWNRVPPQSTASLPPR